MSRMTLVRHRMSGRMWPIGQTAAAAVVAWYLALAVLPAGKPLFAPIAAVIALGATRGQRGRRTVELVGGVILGLAVADLIVAAIGTGPWQAGVMIVLAMGTAVAVGGGELLVSEAAVSAILIATLPGAGGGLPPERFLEALIGGGVALAVTVLLPPDPVLQVGRALNALWAELGGTLGAIARALETGDATAAERALETARGLDHHVGAIRQELLDVSEAARFSPPRRRARGTLDRVSRSLPQVDFAVRDTRVLARNALRYLRGGDSAPAELSEAVAGLAQAVWELAASYDDDRRDEVVQRVAREAAGKVVALAEQRSDLGLAEVVVQVRSVAVDLLRAAELASGAELSPGEPDRRAAYYLTETVIVAPWARTSPQRSSAARTASGTGRRSSGASTCSRGCSPSRASRPRPARSGWRSSST